MITVNNRLILHILFLLALAAVACVSVHAAVPPAGTVISNQASADLRTSIAPPAVVRLISNTVNTAVAPSSVTPATMSLAVSIESPQARRGGTLTISVKPANNSPVPAGPIPLTIDGIAASWVITRITIPANTSLDSILAGSSPLYHLAGTPEQQYTAIQPASLAEVDAVAFPRAIFAAGESLTCRIQLAVHDNVAPTLIVPAAVYFNSGLSPGDNVRVAASAEISVIQPTPISITYYADATFSRKTDVSTLGWPLYVEAEAASCNISSGSKQLRSITISSKLTGDAETYTAQESAVNSGRFRILPSVPTNRSDRIGAVKGDGILTLSRNDTVTARIAECGGTATAETQILIDPFGILFDSADNQPVAGATVTLIDVNGTNNGGKAGEEAQVFNVDGTPAPATVTTAADGAYSFPLVGQGNYRLRITPPNGHSFPSKLPIGELPAGRTIDPSGSYGGDFPVNQQTGAVKLDVPLDPTALDGLFLEKRAVRQVVEIAEPLDYTISLKNNTGQAIAGISIVDQLPLGFIYQKGTARLNGVSLADPAGGKGPALTFAIGTLQDKDSLELTYRVLVGVAADKGDGVNRAQAFGPNGTRSNLAASRVRVSRGVFADEGFIIGKVFVDCNRNRIQDKQELGIPGVRLYLEDGSFVVTDSEGKYSFYGIKPQTHILKLDPITLPDGAELVELSNRNAGDAGSRFVDLKNGELHSADFAEGSCTPDIVRQVKRRRAQGEVFVAETDLRLKARLSLDDQTPLDRKALPATGMVEGSGKVPVFEALLPRPVVRNMEGALPPMIDVAAEMPGMDNTLDFIDLRDGDTLPTSQTNVWVKGTTGGTISLSVNNDLLSRRQIGIVHQLDERKIEALQYVGVDLKPGSNTLEAKQYDNFGNLRASRSITIIAPDKPGKLTIEIPDSNFAADGVTAVPVTIRLSDSAGVPVSIHSILTLESSAGRWKNEDINDKEAGVQVVIDKGMGTYLLLPPQEPGEARIVATSGPLRSEATISFMPDLRPMIAAGIVDGEINFRNRGIPAMTSGAARDGFEREIRSITASGSDGRLEAGARTAFFLKGKVPGDMLLTMSYDSDKDSQERLFRDIQPDNYYPVYGDSSIRGYDAQSTSKFYLRLDKNKSYLLYGDYATQNVTDVRNLGAYNRSLTGVKSHYENRWASLTAFGSDDSSRQVIDELYALGISGPYYLRNPGFLENSERVEIITRNRNQNSIIIKTAPQSRFSDYEIESLTGRLIFREPVPTYDSAGNPNFIRVTYEIEQGGKRFWVYGLEAAFKPLARFELGGTFVRDENPQDKAEVRSVNATFKLAENTFVIAEWAETEKESIGSGSARRIEARHRGDNLELSLYGVTTGRTFENNASSYSKGRNEAGLKGSYRFSEATSLRGEAIYSEDLIGGSTRRGIMANLEHTFSKYLRGEAGLRHVNERFSSTAGGSVSPADYTSLRTRLRTQPKWLPQLSLYGEYEQDMLETRRKMAALGGEYQLANRSRIYARHEFMTSLAGDFNLVSVQQKNVSMFGGESEYMKDGHLFSEYRVKDAVSGREAEAAMGLRNVWRVSSALSLSTGLERIQTLQSTTNNTSTALTAAMDLLASPLWKNSLRVEYRTGAGSDSYLTSLGTAYKISRDITLLARNMFSMVNNGGGGQRVQERFQAGAAYRPVDVNVWNLLNRYEFKYEQDSTLAGQQTERQVNILSSHLNYHPGWRLTLAGHYAFKTVIDWSNGIRSVSTAHLTGGRAIYNITRKWDMGLAGSALFSGSMRSAVYALGSEAGYLFASNVWLSAGYNVFGYRDKDLGSEEYTWQGPYFRLRAKFDEDLFSGGNWRVNNSLVPPSGTAGTTTGR